MLLTPDLESQVGMANQTRPRGSPEAKDRRVTERSRQLPLTARKLPTVPILGGGVADTRGAYLARRSLRARTALHAALVL